MAKTWNEYAAEYRAFSETPKAVLAAVAVAFAARLSGGSGESPTDMILREWNILHVNGIVPQKPPKEA